MRRYSRVECEPIPKDSPIIERQLLTPRTPVHPIIIRKEETPSEEGKFTMEQLCRSFLQRFEDKSDCEFEARELVELTGVKQRRIYDLMNILEGCDLLQRVAKGKYLWFGFGAQVQGRARAKEATSLSCLTARVKEILHAQPNFVDFKEICARVLAEGSEEKINPNSIKRRVYECCKILKILGIVAKKDHTFRWVSDQERRQKPLERTEDTLKAGESELKRREEELMQELLRDVNSQ